MCHTVILFICIGTLYNAEEQALKSLPSVRPNLDPFKEMSVDSPSGQQGQLWSSAQCKLNCLPVECVPLLITAPLPWLLRHLTLQLYFRRANNCIYQSATFPFYCYITSHWKSPSHLKWNINFPSHFPNLRDNMALKCKDYSDSTYE